MPSLTSVQQNQPDTGRGWSRGSPHVNKKRWVNRFKQNLKLKMKTKPKEHQVVSAFIVKSATDGQMETKPHSPDFPMTSSSDEFSATSSEDERFDQASTVTAAELDEPKPNAAEQTKSRDDDDDIDDDPASKHIRKKLIAGLQSVEKGGSLINKWKELSDEFQRRYVISNGSDSEALSSKQQQQQQRQRQRGDDQQIKVKKLVDVEERFGNLSRVIGGRLQSTPDIAALSAKEFNNSASTTTQLESDNTVELELGKKNPFPVDSGELYEGYFGSNRSVTSSRPTQQNFPRDSTTTSGSVRTLSTSDDESLPSFTSTVNMQLLTRPASRYGSAMTSPSYQSTCAVKLSDIHTDTHSALATEAFRQCRQVLQQNSSQDRGFKTVVQVAPPSAFSYTNVRNTNNIVSVAVNGAAATSFHNATPGQDTRQSQTVPRVVQHSGQGHNSISQSTVSIGCRQQSSTTNPAVLPGIISMFKDQTLNLTFLCQNSDELNCSLRRNHDVESSSFVDDEFSTYHQVSATVDFNDSSLMTSCDDAVVQQMAQMTSMTADDDDTATLQGRDVDDDDEITLHETITVEEIDERVIIEIREDLEFRLMKTTQPPAEVASSGGQPKTTVYTALVDRRKQKTTRTEETKNKDSDLTSSENVIASSDSTEMERKFDRETVEFPVSSRDRKLQIQADDNSSTTSTITSPCNWDDKSSIELLTVGPDNTQRLSQYEPENVYFRFTERPKLLPQQQRQQQQNTAYSNGYDEQLARTSFCGQKPSSATVPVLKSTC